MLDPFDDHLLELKTPYALVAESITLIKKYLSNEIVNFEGKFLSVASLKLGLKTRKDIPIYVAGGAPKIMESAGKVADGALINFFNKKLIEKKGGSEGESKKD